MKIKIYVHLKPGILDPQGKAVAGALGKLGFAVSSARVGREIILELPKLSREEAVAAAEDMCRQLLANPISEDCRVVVED
jgi:phosphoribosylformylglycinamidine synthase